MNEKLRFGIVGAGYIAQSYVQAFDGLEQGQIVAVADVREAAASAMAEGVGAESYVSAVDMAESDSLDAAIICTPPATHAEVAEDFLGRGIHCLCEKPFTIDTASARQLAAEAERSGVVLTMASKFRYVDDVIRAKSIVESGILGDIVLFENAFTASVDMSGRWNADPAISGGGVLIDNGTHSLDLTRYFLGPLAEVQVVEGKRLQGIPVEETVRVFVRTEADVMGSIDLSWSIDKGLESYINIYGSRGTVSVGWKGSKHKPVNAREWTQFGKGYDKVSAFRNQIVNFAEAILGQRSLRIDVEDAIASVAAVEAAYAALNSSKWTSIEQMVPSVGKANGQAVTV